MRQKKVLKTIVLSIVAIVMLAFLAALVIVITFAMKHGKDWNALKASGLAIAEASEKEDFCSAATSTVYAADGSVICTLKAEKDVYYLDYEDIPEIVIDTFIAMEDRNFYEHKGIDYKAILRAAWSLYTNKEITQGGSTITQQISRNTYLSHEVTWERKIEEMFLAMGLEEKYSKEEILEFYINGIYFANGNYGIQAAAKGYFGKEISELSLSEVAFLCAIPNNPSTYDPLTNFDNTIKRRDTILNTLYELGIISKDECKEAIVEDIKLNIESDKRSNYVETYVFECATKIIMDVYGCDYQEALMKLYTDGLNIYTSIDTDMQNKLQASINMELVEFTEINDEGIYALQGSGVCLDNDTGYVLAIVGGRSQSIDGYTLNRAFQSYRQPGSAIKPLVTYTPLLADNYGYTADSKVMDVKAEDGPANSNNRYLGKITLREAVVYSKNTVAWELFKEVTAERGLQYLVDMNFEKIVPADYVPAASLGGLTYGASALEMAAAYATIENDGIYRTPTCIITIKGNDGSTIYNVESEEEQSARKRQVYTVLGSRRMTDILQSVMVNGTGKDACLDNMTCAGKTGTTDENKDGWFVGYTPYYTTSIWVGYDMPRSMDDLYGYTYPSRIWKNFMEIIHKDLEYRVFLTEEDYYYESFMGSENDKTDSEDESTDGSNKDTNNEESSNEREPLTDAGVDWEDDIKLP
ncbi:MAG: PBP1A family penicillin-binding protein [Lachnospiraceae bacterium]|nr:PBP1A family penicillin-binding protein [Lachnospiraceae bacterium]